MAAQVSGVPIENATDLEALRRDAERFRWLDKPERAWTFWFGVTHSPHNYTVCPVFGGTSIGAEIDAAMEREQLRLAQAVMV